MTEPPRVVFLFDVDNTLVDNDRVQADLKEAERGNHNFAMVFEENVLRSIGEIDKALLYLRRSIETRKDSTDFATIANTTDVLSEIIVQVAIIDAAGIMRASNVGPQPAPPLDLSDRDHYKVHVNSSEDQLFISQPVIGRASGSRTRHRVNQDDAPSIRAASTSERGTERK